MTEPTKSISPVVLLMEEIERAFPGHSPELIKALEFVYIEKCGNAGISDEMIHQRLTTKMKARDYAMREMP